LNDCKTETNHTFHRASINSQKHADEYNRVNTFTHLYYLQEEPRQAAYNVYSNMSSYFKGRQGGAASSFSTVSFYNEQAKQKRVTAIQRFKVEAELEAQEAAMAAQAETSEASE
jgi:hypothetical protein